MREIGWSNARKKIFNHAYFFNKPRLSKTFFLFIAGVAHKIILDNDIFSVLLVIVPCHHFGLFYYSLRRLKFMARHYSSKFYC